jgi:hypothetical protein
MEPTHRRDVGLVSGLLTVAQALKKHATDGFTTNRASHAPRAPPSSIRPMIDPSTQSTTLKPNRRLDASPAFPDH